MRLAYLDEAGIGEEPTAVVAAVVLNPDTQYLPLERLIEEMMVEYVDPDFWNAPFAFHGKELLWGGKKHSPFPKKSTEDEHRWQILERLLRIPRELDLPLVVGWQRKSDVPATSAHELSLLAHAKAYAACVIGVNYHLRKEEPDQWAMLIAEDRQGARETIQAAHAIFRNSRLMDEEDDDPMQLVGSHIREGILFGARDDALALQLADIVACIIRREIDGSKNNERFMQALFGAAIRMDSFRDLPWGYERFFVQKS